MKSSFLFPILAGALRVAALLWAAIMVNAQESQELKPTEKIDLGDGVTMEFVLIKPGSFEMGSVTHDLDERPVRTVNITQPFYIGRFEVTQAQWVRVMGENPSFFKGDNLPVDSVSWNDCQKFLSALRKKNGRNVALPTEAQWENACRAGTKTQWGFGDDQAGLDVHAWHAGNAERTTHPVGQKKPNAWGLHDMHGNVYEWCADWYSEGPYPSDHTTNPIGPKTGLRRALRGGAWIYVPENLRSADRGFSPPDYRSNEVGLRCVLLVGEQPAQAFSKDPMPVGKTDEASPSLVSRVQFAIDEGDRLAAEFLLEGNEKQAGDPKQQAALRQSIAELPLPAEQLTIDLRNGIVMEFVLIRPGIFTMGSDSSEIKNEKPCHRVTISRPFYLGKYEVTQAQWMALMDRNPSAFIDENVDASKSLLPIDNASWVLCANFLATLNEKFPGHGFRLPTEAEWEYACRAGTKSPHHFGAGSLENFAWFGANSDNRTHPVGQKKANPWGLHDMYGNVWEWCEDRFGRYSAEEAIDPSGPVVSEFAGAKVLRGGAWNNLATHVNSTFRHDAGPNIPLRYYGFRCVAKIPSKGGKMPR